MAALRPPETIRLYLNAAASPTDALPPFETVPMPFPRGWTHARLSWEMTRRRPDVLFVPAYVVPLIHPRSVVTVHDLGYLREPDAHPPAARRRLDWSTRWSVRVAHRVIVPSASTARDLVGLYGVPAARVRVVHHGVAPAFRPPPAAAVAAVRRRLGLPDAFVLAVGTVQPRKNYGRLVAAMRTVAAAGLPHRLVIAGKRGWLAGRVEREVAGSGVADRVVWAGYVSAGDLPALYGAADAFCLPSLHEGFGLPALEAMASGVPAVLADRAALPEVAGDAALLVEPTDADAIGAALVQVLTNGALRERLRGGGLERAAGFTWERSAQETLAVLREVVRG
jgi:glycosyltransferase involved in cell wall biosynthesis